MAQGSYKKYGKLLFIVNPHAGMRRKDSPLSEIILTFSDHGYETVVCFTRETGDATRLVEEHADVEIDRIACMGGDGTLNEVIAGCRSVGWDKPLGYIPAGTTNDFAASLGLPTDPVEAARRAVTGEARRLDIGDFDGRTFVYTASSGIFTKASYETPQRAKNLLGHFAYVIGGMKDITQIKTQHMRILTEGKVYEDDYLFVAVCNTFSLGGVMSLGGEDVDLADGLFEILLISRPHDLIQLNLVLRALNEQRYNAPGLHFFKTDHALISAGTPPDWSLDGEFGRGQTTSEFQVVPGGIRMVY